MLEDGCSHDFMVRISLAFCHKMASCLRQPLLHGPHDTVSRKSAKLPVGR